MRNKILILVIFYPLFLSAQGEDERIESDFQPGIFWIYTGLKPGKPDKARKYDRLVFDLTYNDWVGDRKPFSNHWGSIGLNTNLIFDIPLAKKNVVALGLGLCHQWVNIRHDNHLYRNDLTESTEFVEKTISDNFNKSKYGSHTVALPIELRFRTAGWQHFKFHIGGKVGYVFRSLSKYKGSTDFDYVSTSFGFHDDAKLMYSAHFRIGVRNWALFGNYQINKLFLSDQSVKLNLIQFGLSISVF